jgi:hypothetical protein
MTLPNYDQGPDEPGGQTRVFGGRDFLRQLTRMKVQLPVIVVTQFQTFNKQGEIIGLSDLERQLSKLFPHSFRAVVSYHAAVHGWRDQLSSLIADELSALEESE